MFWKKKFWFWRKNFRLWYRYQNWTLVSVPNTKTLFWSYTTVLYNVYELWMHYTPILDSSSFCQYRIEKESEADKRFPGFEQFSIQTQCKFLLHKIANSPQLFARERSIIMFDGFSKRRRNVRFYNKASFYHFAKNKC